jgi:hypothetical protein
MLTQIKKQPSMLGIAAGGRAAINIPTTGTHYALFLECTTAAGVALTRAQIIADVGDIIVRIDGTEIITATATFLLDLQKYYGDAIGAGNVNGYIPIFFTPAHLPSFAERAVYALGTSNIGVISVEAAIVGVVVLKIMNVYSEVTPEVRVLGTHLRIKRFPQSFATTGNQEITTLPKEGAQVGYRALHVENPAGSLVTYATIKIGGNAIFDTISAGLNKVLLQRESRTPQTLYYHIDFAKNRSLDSYLPMANVQDFRQTLNWDVAPTNFNIYAEQIWGLGK